MEHDELNEVRIALTKHIEQLTVFAEQEGELPLEDERFFSDKLVAAKSAYKKIIGEEYE